MDEAFLPAMEEMAPVEKDEENSSPSPLMELDNHPHKQHWDLMLVFPRSSGGEVKNPHKYTKEVGRVNMLMQMYALTNMLLYADADKHVVDVEE